MNDAAALVEDGGNAAHPAPTLARVAAVAPQAVAAAANPLDLPADVFRSGLDRRKANRAALMEWIRAALVEGVDYGVIQTKRGPSKPSLWKPGAEKICGMLGVTVHFPTLHDYEQAALHGIDLKAVVIRCEIRDAAGRIVADGVGARALAQDFGDLNKALKMAEKSAHIDATLRMAGLSEVFTQDLEDMVGGGAGSPAPIFTEPPSAPAPAVAEPQVGKKISAAQKKRLEARIGELGLERERVKSWVARAWGVEHFADLDRSQYERLDAKLTQWHEQWARTNK